MGGGASGTGIKILQGKSWRIQIQKIYVCQQQKEEKNVKCLL